jgi:hypothetical protein
LWELKQTKIALTDNLVSYWKLDETSGTRYDSTDTNNDLTDNNTVTYDTGKIENAAKFTRTNSESLSIADASQTGLDPTGDFSISLWMSKTSDFQMAFVTKEAAGSRALEFMIYSNVNGGKPFCYINDTSYVEGTTNLGYAGAWHHIVLTYDYVTSGTSVMKMYVDGSLEGTTSNAVGPLTNSTAAFYIGARGGYSDNYFNGLIDEVGYWSRTLTQAEVTSLYNSGNGLAYPFASSTNYTCSSVNTMTLSKAYSPLTNYLLSRTLTLTETDTSSFLSQYNLNQLDTLSLRYLTLYGREFFLTIQDSIEETDNLNIDLTLGITCMSTLGLSDATTNQMMAICNVIDTIIMSDSTSNGNTFGVTVQDALYLKDALIKAGWSWKSKYGSGSDWDYQTKQI